MTALPVNEIFVSIQGEASWTGTPAVFIRLQGCDVGCPWCDTKETWALDPDNETAFSDIAAKSKSGSPAFARASPQVLRHAAASIAGGARHIVITGGEPCQYDLTELTTELMDAGFTVQVETSGTEPIRVAVGTWVTLSPKIHMPGGRRFLAASLGRAEEIKMPVGKPADIERLLRLLENTVPGFVPREVWLQPLSQSDKATELCVATAIRLGWKLSLQTHKYMGVR